MQDIRRVAEDPNSNVATRGRLVYEKVHLYGALHNCMVHFPGVHDQPFNQAVELSMLRAYTVVLITRKCMTLYILAPL